MMPEAAYYPTYKLNLHLLSRFIFSLYTGRQGDFSAGYENDYIAFSRPLT
jgi:hypothetical protein